MGDYVATDPRGILVVFEEAAWEHAGPHHEELGANFMRVALTLRLPDVILDNPQVPGRTRKAHERYVRRDEKQGCYLIVPTMILSSEQHVPGYGKVGQGTRVAVSAYASDNIPVAGVIWRKV